MAQWFTVEELGPTRSLTPEGFLLCKNVVLARTGMQLYGPGETPIDAIDGQVRIQRDPDEVFHPDAIASAQGKPIVNEHPEDGDGMRLDVTPANWRELAIGHVVNPRRGDGADEDFLVGDLLITDQHAIDLIDAGKRELSCGYAADYEETGPGRGRQKNIRINHVALVERGRCGPRCAIGDAEEKRDMPSPTLPERIRAAFWSRDHKALDQMLEEGGDPTGGGMGAAGNGGSPPAIHVHLPNGAAGGDQPATGGGVEERLTALEAAVAAIKTAVEQLVAAEAQGGAVETPGAGEGEGAGEEGEEMGDNAGTEGNEAILPGFEMEAPPATADRLKKARDSALMSDSFAATVALGEILVPGVRLPTFDRAAPPQKTFDALCQFRRTVLDLAWAKPDTRELIEEASGGHFDGTKRLDCRRVRDLFFSVGAIKRRLNNNAAGGGNPDAPEYVFGGGVAAGVQSPADIQRLMNEHYGAKH